MYAKLFSRISQSSLMEEDIDVRYCFMMMLAIADPEGDVVGTDIAVARIINMPLDRFRDCVETLMSPDPNSNSMAEDGRRVVACENARGYHLVNYKAYRGLKSEEEKREYMKNYMRDRRRKEAISRGEAVNVKPCKVTLTDVKNVTQAEAEAEAKEVSAPDSANPPPLAPTRKRSKPEDPLRWSLETGWIGISEADRAEWESAFPACNIDTQLAAATVWLKANPAKAKKSQWRRFISSWLSRSQERGGDAGRAQISPNLAHRAEKAAKEYPQYIEPKILKIRML